MQVWLVRLGEWAAGVFCAHPPCPANRTRGAAARQEGQGPGHTGAEAESPAASPPPPPCSLVSHRQGEGAPVIRWNLLPGNNHLLRARNTHVHTLCPLN